MTIRFMTYNIQDGGRGRERPILQVLSENHPDIVVLQEVAQTLVQSLAHELDLGFFYAEGRFGRHLALLSRFPITSRQSYCPFPPISSTILDATVEYSPNQSLSLLGVHLVPHPAIVFEGWRTWEMRVALHYAGQHRNLSLIAGDYNAVAPRDHVVTEFMPARLKVMLTLQGGRFFHRAIKTTLSAGYTDCYRYLHPDEDGFTLPVPKSTIRLDYVFANAALKVSLQKCYVVSDPVAVLQASDHHPVMAEFAL